jgi:hypothetical protein
MSGATQRKSLWDSPRFLLIVGTLGALLIGVSNVVYLGASKRASPDDVWNEMAVLAPGIVGVPVVTFVVLGSWAALAKWRGRRMRVFVVAALVVVAFMSFALDECHL